MRPIWDTLTFRRMISPAVLQFLFWAGIGGTLYGTWVLIQLEHWAWPLALVFGVLVVRVIFERLILAFRAYGPARRDPRCVRAPGRRGQVSSAAWAGSLALCVSAAAASDDVASLTVNVVGGKPGRGQVVASLFDSKETYMKAPVAEDRQSVGADGRARLMFSGLQPGDYAVSIFHDEDSDGELDTNFLGIPTEKVGFSNDAKPRMGPAPYDKARLHLTPGSTEITINLGRARRQR